MPRLWYFPAVRLSPGHRVVPMKELALWLYRFCTARRRQHLLARLRQSGQVPVAILFYHRVADDCPNAWSLPTADFARHLDWLQQHFDIVSLAEAQRRITSGSCQRPTVSITFDDGYADNARFAIPELVRRNLTATYFVATEFVRTQRPFPHDVAAGQPLPPNTVDQLRAFAEQGIEIGAHTCRHVDLGRVAGTADIEEEIVGSAQQLEQWLDRPVRYFAFPYGLPANMTQAAVDVIAAHGFHGFCSAFGDWNWPGSGGYHLRRIHADPGCQRLKNWLTLDPRKLQRQFSLPFVEPPHTAVATMSPALQGADCS